MQLILKILVSYPIFSKAITLYLIQFIYMYMYNELLSEKNLFIYNLSLLRKLSSPKNIIKCTFYAQ